MGIGPTGKQVTVSGLTLSRLANGKVIEEYTNWGDVRDDAAT
jgi:predicted ester cyclase